MELREINRLYADVDEKSYQRYNQQNLGSGQYSDYQSYTINRGPLRKFSHKCHDFFLIKEQVLGCVSHYCIRKNIRHVEDHTIIYCCG